MTDFFFVYGTLKKGFGNHRLLEREGVLFCRPSWTLREYNFVRGAGFPYVCDFGPEETKGFIRGELYQVKNSQVVADMDWLEGHPTFYKREEITLENNSKVWCYLYQGRDFPNERFSKPKGLYHEW